MSTVNYTNCCNEFCRELPEKLRAELCAHKIITRAKKKHSFIFDVNQIVIIRSGVIIPSFLREDGKEKGLSLKPPGSLLGVSQMFSDKDMMFNIYVIEDFEGCVFPVHYFEHLFEKDPDFAKEIVRKFSDSLTSYSEFTSELALGNSENKVEALFNFISSNCAFEDLNLTHDEMAVLLGINRVTVTKVFSSMKKKTTR